MGTSQKKRPAGGETTVRCEIPTALTRTFDAAPPPPGHGARDPDPAQARFAAEGEIARGGMGRVWQAFDRVLLRRVAMKEVAASLLETLPDIAKKFIEEAQITGQLDHPHIVPVHDLVVDSDEPQLVMKLVEGETLGARMERMHQSELNLDELERVLQMFLRVCDAVAFAHSRGVIHRDIKPDNIMVGTHGQVYLMDWGVSLLTECDRPSEGSKFEQGAALRTSGSHPPRSGSVAGTPEYMAPEQALGRVEDIDERTDVYGLGGLLHFLVAGVGPNAEASPAATMARARSSDPREPERWLVWPETPPSLCAIIKKALAVEQDHRYPNVEALVADVEDYLRGGGWFQTRRYQAGDVIVKEGDPGDSAFIIVDGECEAYKTGAGGSLTPLRKMHAGDVFGETAVLTEQPRTASVAAITDVTVRIVTERALQLELERSRWLGAFVLALAQRFRDTDAQLAKLREEAEASD